VSTAFSYSPPGRHTPQHPQPPTRDTWARGPTTISPAPYQRKPSKQKSTLAYNLGRIIRVLEPDLLASALGVSESVLNTLLRDADRNVSEQYRPRLVEKLGQGGLPAAWLWTPNITLRPEHIEKLRKMASQASNKAPIRRANFLKLVKAFEHNMELLADALEMNLDSVLAVADGKLPLDEQRFGHINPILAQAGFPDGWLEEDDAPLSKNGIERLEALAVDSYERDICMYEDYLNKNAPTKEEDLIPTQQLIEAESGIMETIASTQSPSTQTDPEAISQVVVPPAEPPKLPGMINPPTPVTTAYSSDSPLMAAATALKAKKGSFKVDPVIHVKRYEALKRLIDESPSSVVSVIFEDALGGYATEWSQMKTLGKKWFTDEFARKVETALELPNLWFDNPTFPPASLVAWMTDKSAPKPPKKAKKTKELKASATSPQQMSAPASKIEEVSTQPVVAPTSAIPQASPPKPQIAQTRTAPLPTYDQAQAIPGAGPITQAAVATILGRIKEGTFTEMDGLKLLNSLMLPND